MSSFSPISYLQVSSKRIGSHRTIFMSYAKGSTRIFMLIGGLHMPTSSCCCFFLKSVENDGMDQLLLFTQHVVTISPLNMQSQSPNCLRTLWDMVPPSNSRIYDNRTIQLDYFQFFFFLTTPSPQTRVFTDCGPQPLTKNKPHVYFPFSKQIPIL